MRIVSVAALSLVGVLGVASVANADGWKGPISDFLNPNTNTSTAGVQGNTTLTTNTYNETHSVPVPGTFALFAGGFGLFAAWHRRSRQE